ncbi:Putative glycerophosphodiester phosphodiesterase YhdW (Glycerophosphoryl diester phosphodiesterase), partial [Durusdinium trenchii]
AEIYDKLGRSANFHLPDDARPPQPAWAPRWTPRLTFWSAVAVICASGAAGLTAIHSVRLEDATEITAHRGASGSAPENTLAAVREAIEAGADWVEIDVQESKEGVVVVAHDSDLKKLSGSDAKIWELTLDELRQIDIGSRFGPEFSVERVPTLEQVLDVCRGRVGLNIELKYYGHDQDLERKVVQLVEARGMQDDVLIMSLEARGIERIKRLRPDWTVGLLIAVAAGDLTNVDADFLAVNTGLATRRLIVSAHNKGKRVFVWTVNDPIQMSIMISRGADPVPGSL